MMQPKREMNKFTTFNRSFMKLCLTWASLNAELDLPTGFLLKFFDQLTLVWSILILITSLLKFFIPLEVSVALISPDLNSTRLAEPQRELRDLLLLNYLPRVNEFGKLYYGLVSVSVGAPLLWRIYLNYLRPRRRNSKTPNAARKLVLFFINGPNVQIQSQVGCRHSLAKQLLKSDDINTRLFTFDLDLITRSRRKTPLSTLHHQLGARESKEADEVYRNPIRSHDFLADYSTKRWMFLARHVYCMILFIITVSLPIMYFTILGLDSVLDNFGHQSGEDSLLHLYGVCEQFYAITQAALFFVFTNIFIALFYADLMYKSAPIRLELRELDQLYQVDMQRRLEKSYEEKVEMNLKQLRLWAYFDNIDQLDSFVNKYSIMSLLILVIGLSFGQSFLRIEIPELWMGTAAVLSSNIISFTFLYLISWRIEQRVSRIRILF